MRLLRLKTPRNDTKYVCKFMFKTYYWYNRKVMSNILDFIKDELELIKDFLAVQGKFLNGFGNKFLGWVGLLKNVTTKSMYRQRGRFSQTFINVTMALFAFLTVIFSSKLEDLINNKTSDAST